jgi:hypothetical protein
MRHRVFFAALLVAVAAVFAFSGAAVAGQPIGGCPNDGYTLIRAKVDPVVDKNGDGWICTKPVGTGFNDIDNKTNKSV